MSDAVDEASADGAESVPAGASWGPGLAFGGAALAEGLVALHASATGGASAVDALGAALLGAATVAALLWPLAALTVPLRRSVGVRGLAEGLRRGLGGGVGRGSLGLALAMAMLVAGVGVVVGALVGRWFVSAMSPRFAALGTALATIGAAALALVLAAGLGGLLARGLGRLSEDARARGAKVLLVLGPIGLAFLIVAFLPVYYAFAPFGAVAGLSAGALLRRRASARAVRNTRIGLSALAVSCVLLAWVPASTLTPVVYQTPYAGFALGAVQSFFDADGDGYSRVLLGGDCDDQNPSIHPVAEDIVGNGIDENCSGADAGRYTPPPPLVFERPAAMPERLNVVLLMVDALRPDHMGFAGYERETTPELDRFQREAVWFRNAYTTAPSTRFALSTLFTGKDPRRVPHRDLGHNRFQLLPAATTVAERLRSARYDAVGYTISYVMHHNLGLGEGFREWRTPWPVDDWAQIYGVAAEQTTDAGLRFLEGRGEGATPFYLYLHYRCTHDPYVAHDEWDFGDDPVGRYDSALSYCDQQIHRFLEGLESGGEAERTAIVLLSDHGELFGEHGLENHGNSLFENDVRIVMLLRAPGLEPAIVDRPVSLADVAPTVYELASVEAPADLDGRSLLTEQPVERPLFFFTDLWRGTVRHQAAGVLVWPHKYLRDQVTGAEHLFDVSADPEEERDLAASDSRRRSALAEILDGYLAYAR